MTEQFINTPSSGASRHLLPAGEKKPVAMLAPPSPHRGEGGSPPGLAFGQPEGRLREPGEGAPITIAAETAADIGARDALLDRAMGPRWRRKSSEKLRRGRLPAEGLAFVARDEAGRVVGTVRLWDVAVGVALPPLDGEGGREAAGWGDFTPSDSRSLSLALPEARPEGSAPPPSRGGRALDHRALLLGPLAVDPSAKSAGIGSALMRHAIAEAARLGHRAILLVGDAAYYARFGFSAEKTDRLAMPGPYEKHRFLALELAEGALDGAAGVLKASGRRIEAAHRRLAA